MSTQSLRLVVAAAAILTLVAGLDFGIRASHAQSSFSCPWGKRGACLDYGDTVCSTFGKCVDQNAVCFSQFTCDYNGFVCKSALDDLARECERLRGDHNDLVRLYNDLLQHARNLESDLDEAQGKLRRVRSCVDGAYDLDDARGCVW